jgi:8-oxo-dGTP pyrophosphatase MutT (NUDIX family)
VGLPFEGRGAPAAAVVVVVWQGGPVELLPAGHPDLAPSADPSRSAARVETARLDTAAPRRDRERILSLLADHGAALADRRTAPGHLTGSALVVDAALSRVLLLLHAKLGRWLQPGGHADGDHELAGVALREASEETGIEGLSVLVPAVDVDIHTVDHGDALGEHLHLDVRFVVVAPDGAVEHGNHESLALRWVAPDEVGALCHDDGIVRLVAAARAASGEWEGGRPEVPGPGPRG